MGKDLNKKCKENKGHVADVHRKYSILRKVEDRTNENQMLSMSNGLAPTIKIGVTTLSVDQGAGNYWVGQYA